LRFPALFEASKLSETQFFCHDGERTRKYIVITKTLRKFNYLFKIILEPNLHAYAVTSFTYQKKIIIYVKKCRAIEKNTLFGEKKIFTFEY
jgi:hypothetical protein